MSSPKKRSEDLLRRLVSILIEEWGYRAVADAIHEAAQFRSEERQAGSPLGKRSQKTRSRQKHTPLEQVSKLDLPAPTKALLSEIAIKFQNKALLPRLSDIHQFLQARGQIAYGIRDRSDAFRKILTVLINMPIDKLEKFTREPPSFGPSELAPLSEAIKLRGAEFRSKSAEVPDSLLPKSPRK